MLRVHRILPATRMAGPGLRFCVWVQGCSRHCQGCAAVDTWPHNAGVAMAIEDLKAQILRAARTQQVEGLTLLGGEPFEQACAAAELAALAQAAGLSVVTFTGYTYEELLSAAAFSATTAVRDLLAATDILIDGAFVASEFSLARPWVGSSNQRYHFLTRRYDEQESLSVENQIEIRIATDGTTLVNGMGDFALIRGLAETKGEKWTTSL